MHGFIKTHMNLIGTPTIVSVTTQTTTPLEAVKNIENGWDLFQIFCTCTVHEGEFLKGLAPPPAATTFNRL